MHVALIISAALVGTGAVLYLHHRIVYGKPPQAAPPEEKDEKPAEECCGMHITCERDSLSPVFTEKPEYFDDEELDAYAGRGADAYTDEETDQFRDVLLTLRPDDIAPWARSVQMRGITLPTPIRDELIMIVNEARALRTATAAHE